MFELIWQGLQNGAITLLAALAIYGAIKVLRKFFFIAQEDRSDFRAFLLHTLDIQGKRIDKCEKELRAVRRERDQIFSQVINIQANTVTAFRQLVDVANWCRGGRKGCAPEINTDSDEFQAVVLTPEPPSSDDEESDDENVEPLRH